MAQINYPVPLEQGDLLALLNEDLPNISYEVLSILDSQARLLKSNPRFMLPPKIIAARAYAEKEHLVQSVVLFNAATNAAIDTNYWDVAYECAQNYAILHDRLDDGFKASIQVDQGRLDLIESGYAASDHIVPTLHKWFPTI